MSFAATALITGGTSGLGYTAARHIAKQRPNWQILIASRDGLQSAHRLNIELKKTGNTPNVFYLPLDCSSKWAVRQFAQDYSNAGHPPIKALLLNAGVQIVSGVKYSADGYEMTMATNHVGQALLFYLLQPHLADDAHIIYTGSGLHKYRESRNGKSGGGPVYISAEKCAHPGQDKESNSNSAGQRRYALSKLVNALWMYALRDKVSVHEKGWTVAVFEPGEKGCRC
jgi:NAD(P)-dependent dehydrogenase (short-subunit alcohol dehydrogenase family)